VIYIDQGSILEIGKPDEFFDNPKNDRARSFLARVLNVELGEILTLIVISR